jgi:S-adenosylmethionine:tRNA ribosyltransferase-isomerase
MKKQDFYFDLPAELIAQYPLPRRTDSRLLAYNRHTGECRHQQFKDIIHFLNAGDLLVLNNTRVIPARLHGHKRSGGKIEVLIERFVQDDSFLAHIKASKAPRAGTLLDFDKGWTIEVLAKQDDLYHCRTLGDAERMLQEIGHIPLPLYIAREDEPLDVERYQTVYALHKGSVAAPTAGLHFDELLLQALREKGVKLAYTTLHVGAGTFRPLRCENINEHKMHREQFVISKDLACAVNATKAQGHKVIAVGTTALRSLESAVQDGMLKPCDGDTDLFIYPGYQFQICDGLVTNFHLAESTLLVLVSAFIGHAETMALYQEAIAQRYRFFSYGDATLLL